MNWSEMTLTVEQIDPSRSGDIYVYVFLKDGFPIKHDKAFKHYLFSAREVSHRLHIEVPDIPFAIKVHHDQIQTGRATKYWT